MVESLLSRLPDEEACRIRAIVDLGGKALEVDQARLRYVANTPCERLLDMIPRSTVSVVYSLALLEHVQDLGRGLESLYAALRPGGEMIHRVDLRNHGVLDEFGEAAFLRPSPAVWRLMGGAWGLPNRKALGFYKESLEDLGAEVSVESDAQYEAGRLPCLPEKQRECAVRVFWLHARHPELLEPGRDGSSKGTDCSASLS